MYKYKRVEKSTRERALRECDTKREGVTLGSYMGNYVTSYSTPHLNFTVGVALFLVISATLSFCISLCYHCRKMMSTCTNTYSTTTTHINPSSNISMEEHHRVYIRTHDASTIDFLATYIQNASTSSHARKLHELLDSNIKVIYSYLYFPSLMKSL